VGKTLKSGTNEVSAHRVLRHEKYYNKLVLVDTPGFDDASKTDNQILRMISQWLTKAYVGVSADARIMIRFSNLSSPPGKIEV